MLKELLEIKLHFELNVNIKKLLSLSIFIL